MTTQPYGNKDSLEPVDNLQYLWTTMKRKTNPQITTDTHVILGIWLLFTTRPSKYQNHQTVFHNTKDGNARRSFCVLLQHLSSHLRLALVDREDDRHLLLPKKSRNLLVQHVTARLSVYDHDHGSRLLERDQRLLSDLRVLLRAARGRGQGGRGKGAGDDDGTNGLLLEDDTDAS